MKTNLILIIALILLTGFVSAQDNKASVSLTAAIYEEEVTGNLDKAVRLYLGILKQYPDNREVGAKTLYHLGLVSEKMGQQKATEYFTQLVKNYPDQIEMVALAKEKLTLYNRATAETTLKAQQSFNLAADLFKQSEYKEAIKEYEKVIRLIPISQLAQEARLWIGQCYFKDWKYDQALKIFNAIVKEFPGSTIIPVTELMISQVRKSISEEPKTSTTIALDDKTILDTATGVRYTRINSWAGKNDIIKSTTDITDISPNRKFLLYENTVVPFDHTDSFTLFDGVSFYHNSRLSPDGTQVAYFTKNGISVIPVSPETGKPTGLAQKLLNKEFLSGWDISWSPNGKSILFSIQTEDKKFSIWEFSFKDNSIKQVSNPSQYAMANMIYSKNGSNFLYEQYDINGYFTIKMKSITGKSLTLLDSVSGQGKKFILSPDNQWIMYDKVWDKKMLYRLADKQRLELSTPEVVGDYVSWAEQGNKAFFYKSSYEDMNVLKVISVFGGPPFEFQQDFGQFPVGWTPDGNSIIASSRVGQWPYNQTRVSVIDLSDRTTRSIEDLYQYSEINFSPDYTRAVVQTRVPGQPVDLMVVPVSLKEGRISGDPLILVKGFKGRFWYDPWSPDSKKVVFSLAGDLWIAYADGIPPIQLTKTSTYENYPIWSPDGEFIAVYSEGSLVRVIRASDGELQRVIEKVDYWDWAPSGKEVAIAFYDGRLEYISVATGKSRKVGNWKELSGCSGLNFLECSPDGKWIAINGYYEDSGDDVHMYLINTLNGTAIEIDGDDTRNKDAVLWSPDSKWILYNTYGPKKTGLAGTLWEADLTDFMKTIKPGTETGYTTDFDFKTHTIPEGGIAPDGIFTDARDGHVYKYKNIGEQTWMAENLAYLPKVNPDSATSSEKRYYVYGYEGSDVIAAKTTENFQKFGVLYNWPAAMNGGIASNAVPSGIQGSCPSGWHVPSDAEWMILEKTLGMSEADLIMETPASFRISGSVDTKLKSPFGWEDDDILVGQSGFNTLQGGLIYPGGGGKALNHSSYFWTATSFNDLKAGARGVSSGLYRWTGIHKEYGNSVRCVKD